MSWIAVAIGGSALLSAYSSNKAAGQASDAANRATDTQLGMFNTINQQQQPWRTAGEGALGTIADLQPQFTHQFNAQDLNANLAPNYAFQLGQGQGAIQNAANRQTGLVSGNAMKGLEDYTQNFAQNAYQNAFGNYSANQTNIFNRLSNIAGLGQTANANVGNAGSTISGNAANSMIAGGQSQAAGSIGVGNALSGGANSALGWYSLPQIMNGSFGSGSTLGGGGYNANMDSFQNQAATEPNYYG